MEKAHSGLATAVFSGDKIGIQGREKEGEVPMSKELFLAYIEAPRMQLPHKSAEPFALAAREFVRKLIIGKKIFFSVEYSKDEREFCIVWNDDPASGKALDIAAELVKEGLASVRSKLSKEEGEDDSLTTRSRYLMLKGEQDYAKKHEKGIWNKKAEVVAENSVDLIFPGTPNFDHFKIQEAIAKMGGRAEGIIEYIFSPCGYNVLLPKLNVVVKIYLESVTNTPSGVKSTEEQQKIAKRGKSYAERIAQHQNVIVELGAYDTSNSTFTGRITLADGKDVACALIAQGYAKLFVQKTANDETYFAKLRIALHEAQVGKKGIWKEGKLGKGEEEKDPKAKTFKAKVVEIHSGDSITIEKVGGEEEKRVFLAGIRAPKFPSPNSDEKPQPFAWEAKEFLRKLIIGKIVEVDVEYTKTPAKGEDEPADTKKKPMTFVTITYNEGKCVNVDMVAEGLATSLTPRSDELLSKCYADIVEASTRSKKAKKGIHSVVTTPPVHSYHDLVGNNNPKTLIYYTEVFKKNPKATGIVEYCFSGSRFKFRVNETTCYIAFVCQGLQPLPQDPNLPEVQAIFKKGQKFARSNVLQRDAEIEAISWDKKGNCFGVLYINGKNYALSLLEEGLALINTSSGRGPYIKKELYYQAEEKAKKNLKGVWNPKENISIDSIRPVEKEFEQVEGKSKVEIVSYLSNRCLYGVYTDDTNVKKLEAVLVKEFDPKKAEKLQPPIRRGTYCMALYSEDKRWYRGLVEKANTDSTYSVLFIDYGNMENVTLESIVKIDSKLLKDYPPNGIKLGLAYLNIPPLDTEVEGKKLRSILQNQLDEKEVEAQFKYKEDGIVYSIIQCGGEANPMKSLNAYLLKRGLAKVSKQVKLPGFLTEWKDIQDKARSEQAGFWETNELGEGSDEEA